MHLARWSVPLLLATTGCAAKSWKTVERPVGEPVVTPLEDSTFTAASSVEESDDGIAVTTSVEEIRQQQLEQEFRIFEQGRYDRESANEAGVKWFVISGIVGLVSLAFFLPNEDTGEPFSPTAGGVGLLTAVGLAAGGGAQYASPYLPPLRRDMKREQRTWTVDLPPTPATMTDMSLRSEVVLTTATTDGQGEATLRLPGQVPDSIALFALEQEVGSHSLIPTGTWLSSRVATIEAAVTEGELDEARAVVLLGAPHHSSALWSAYCDALDPELGGDLDVALVAVRGAPDVECASAWKQVRELASEPLLEAALSGEQDRLADLRDGLGSAYEWERLGAQLEDCSAAARGADGPALVSPHWTRLDQLDQSEFELVQECSRRARELIRPKFEQEAAERREKERRKAAREAALDAFYRDEGLSVNFVTHGSARVSDLLETYAGCDATRVLGIPNSCSRNNSRVISQFRRAWCPRNWSEALGSGGREVAEEVRRDFCESGFGANPQIGTDGCIKVLKEWCP